MDESSELTEEKTPKIKGSTIIIVFMYATWILYLAFQLYVKTLTNAWLPSEVTYGTAALFIVETVSLARLKMAKEGTVLDKKQTNAFASRLGLSSTLDSFEQDAQKISEQNQQQTKGVTVCQTKSSVSSPVVNSGSQSQLSSVQSGAASQASQPGMTQSHL